MRKILVFILSLIYMAASAGTNISMHYCMGKLADWSIGHNSQKDTCGKCGMEKNEKPDGCCSDEEKWVKIENDQKLNFSSLQLVNWEMVKSLVDPDFRWSPLTDKLNLLVPNSHAPPIPSLPLYKRIRVFLI